LATVPKNREELRAPGRPEARAVGASSALALAWSSSQLVLPHPSGADTAALIVIAVAMAAAGLLCWLLLARIPIAVTHLALRGPRRRPGCCSEERRPAGQYGSSSLGDPGRRLLLSASRRDRPPRLAARCLRVTLAVVESTAGYSPLSRWLFTAVSLAVVMP